MFVFRVCILRIYMYICICKFNLGHIAVICSKSSTSFWNQHVTILNIYMEVVCSQAFDNIRIFTKKALKDP